MQNQLTSKYPTKQQLADVLSSSNRFCNFDVEFIAWKSCTSYSSTLAFIPSRHIPQRACNLLDGYNFVMVSISFDSVVSASRRLPLQVYILHLRYLLLGKYLSCLIVS